MACFDCSETHSFSALSDESVEHPDKHQSSDGRWYWPSAKACKEGGTWVTMGEAIVKDGPSECARIGVTCTDPDCPVMEASLVDDPDVATCVCLGDDHGWSYHCDVEYRCCCAPKPPDGAAGGTGTRPVDLPPNDACELISSWAGWRCYLERWSYVAVSVWSCDGVIRRRFQVIEATDHPCSPSWSKEELAGGSVEPPREP